MVGLASNLVLVYTAVVSGTAAVVLTFVLAYVLSFWDFIANLPLALRAGFYVCVFVLAFVLITYARLHGPVLAGYLLRPRQRVEEPLEAYKHQMRAWMHDPDRPLRELPSDHDIRMSARQRTLAELGRQSPNGKREVVEFLLQHQLIQSYGEHTPIIFLHGSDLSGAGLSNMVLKDMNLQGANLRGADLSGAVFCGWIFEGVLPPDMDRGKPTGVSNFVGTDLSDAVLRRATLAGCQLAAKDFTGADLDRADLRGADLLNALHLTQAQVEQSYGSCKQEGWQDALLPHDLNYPEAWRKPIREQRADRERNRGAFRRLARFLRIRY
ncbi:MAG: pentapeptide repeat-containing protein [Rubrobacter sp.]|nr:pentapeptide repeat-containing protein [Rubrobacter sp.]